MCILSNFMEDAIFDAEYQDYLYQQQKQKNEMLDYLYRMEQQAYDIMCEQANKDQELYETLIMEREYKTIMEWEDLQTI
jgi:hypothetical protein